MAAAAYQREMSATTGVTIGATASAAEAVREADVICAATSTKTPVFSDADLKVGVHINGVGSYHPTMQEIPTETVLRARVVVDHRESALAEAGDLLVPIQQGRNSAERIAAELGEIVSGTKPDRDAGCAARDGCIIAGQVTVNAPRPRWDSGQGRLAQRHHQIH